MEVHHPAKLIRVLTRSIVEAEQIPGASGAAKEIIVLEATRRHAVHSMVTDDALLVAALAPAIVDSVVAASKGQLDIKVQARCFDEACCSSIGGCCTLL